MISLPFKPKMSKLLRLILLDPIFFLPTGQYFVQTRVNSFFIPCPTFPPDVTETFLGNFLARSRTNPSPRTYLRWLDQIFQGFYCTTLHLRSIRCCNPTPPLFTLRPLFSSPFAGRLRSLYFTTISLNFHNREAFMEYSVPCGQSFFRVFNPGFVASSFNTTPFLGALPSLAPEVN